MNRRIEQIAAFGRQAVALASALLLLLMASGARAADIGWVNPAGGSFSEPTNWSSGTVPGAGDNAIITLEGTYTVTLDNATELSGLSLGGGGSQTLVLASSLSVSAATINASGVLSGSGSLAAGTLSVLGSYNWSGGTITGTINVPPGGRLNIGAGGDKILAGAINNAGITTWSNASGNDAIDGAGNFNNLPEGQFNNAAAVSFSHNMNAALNNAGTINGLSGQLNFDPSSFDQLTGISTGIFNAAGAGTTIVFSRGRHILNTGARFTGPGVTRIADTCDVLVQGSVAVIGTVEMSGSGSNGEVLFGPGTMTVVAGANFNWKGGLIGTREPAIANGALDIAPGGRLNISAGGDKTLIGTINNAGITTWSNAVGNDVVGGEGSFNNLASGQFNNAVGVSFSHSMNAALNNAGIVNGQSGLLSFDPSSFDQLTGISTGIFNAVGAGTTISFTRGRHILNTGARFTGPGVTRIADTCDVLVQGSVAVIGTVEMSGSGSNGEVLFGPGTLSVASGANFNWKGGVIGTQEDSIRNGVLAVAPGGRFNIGAGGFKTLIGTINNAGITTWSNRTGNDTVNGEGSFNNLASGQFNNAAASSGSHEMNVALNNAGTVNGQSGRLDFDPNGSETLTGQSTGLFSTARGGLITFTRGQHIFGTGARLGGAGIVRLAGGDVLLRGATSVVGLVEMTSSEVSGLAPLSIASGGVFNWSGGPLTEAGALNILRGGTLNFVGTASKALGRRITNSGTISFLGIGGVDGFDGQNVTIANALGGVLNSVARGTTTLNDINLINAGAINPGGARAAGTLAITSREATSGNFSQSASGTLAIEVGGAASASLDRVTVSGRATLGGALVPSLLGSFAPPTGSRFSFLTAPRRTGSFARIVGSPLAGGRVVFAAYPEGRAELVISIAPTVTAITPARGPAGTVVTVFGTNFSDVSRLNLGDTPVLVTRLSPTSVRFTVPSAAQSGRVTVINGAGGGTSAATFVVVPSISSFSPGSGPIAASVLINGANLLGATSVRFGTANATFTRISATQIRATVPAGAASGRISITTPGGVATSAATFIVIPPPSTRGA